MEGYLRCPQSGQLEKWKQESNIPCLHGMASGVPATGLWMKDSLLSVDVG